MKLHKVTLAIAISVLVLASTSFAAEKLAMTPNQATISTGLPEQSVELEAFCSQTPCILHWYVLLSNSRVGGIDHTVGPITNFSAGSLPGTAIVIVKDNQGNMDFSTITVVNVRR